MTDYLYLIGDAYTLDILGEIPFTPTDRYSRLICGCGSFTGTIPLDHPMATRANFKDRMANLIVVRDNDIAWWGPITQPTSNLHDRTLTLNARTPSWWMAHRCLEVSKHYHADSHSIFRKLWTYCTTKTDSVAGDINANLDNITISSGLSGNTKRVPLAGSGRYLMSDIVHDWLVEDPDTGLEYREDFSGAVDDPQVTITLGSPLGSTLTHLLTEHSLSDYGLDLDFERSGTRAHAVGATSAVTQQNTGSIADGYPLLDVVIDRSNIADASALDASARELRRKAQPPVRIPDVEFTPTVGGLEFGFCNLGDTIPFGVRSPDLLTIRSFSRRVVEIAVMPETPDGPESVGLSFNLPLTELGV